MQHVRPVSEVFEVAGTEVVKQRDEPVGTEIVEENVILPEGVDSVPVGGVSIKTSVKDADKTLPDGTWEKTKVITKKVEVIGEVVYAPPGEEVTGFLSPDELAQLPSVTQTPALEHPKSVTKGQVEIRTDVKSVQKVLDDKSTLIQKVTTIQHVCPVSEVFEVAGTEVVKQRDEPVGTEIVEENVILPEGVDSVPVGGVSIKTSVKDADKTLPDGTWEKTKVITKKVEVIGEVVYAPPGEEVTGFLSPDELAQLPSVTETPGVLEHPKSVTKGQVEIRTDVKSVQKVLDDKSTLKQKVTTMKHLRPVSEVFEVAGTEVVKQRDEPIGTEIVEENVILPEGVDSVPIGGVSIKTSVKDADKTLPDGTWEKTKVITKRVEVIGEVVYAPPGEEVSGFVSEVVAATASAVPKAEEAIPKGRVEVGIEAKPLSVRKGDLETETSVNVSESLIGDGLIQKQTVTVIHHLQTVFETYLIGENQVVKEKKEPLGVEIIEENLLLPEGIRSLPTGGVNIETSVQDSEKTKGDGTWERKKVITKRVNVIGPIVYGDTGDVSSPAEPSRTHAVPALTTSMEPLSSFKGDIDSRTDTQVSEQVLEDRSLLKQTVTTISHFRPVWEIVLVKGTEIEQKREEPVGTEIVEDNLILPEGIHSIPAEGVSVKTDVKESEKTRGDGTWEKKKVITKRVEVMGDIKDGHDEVMLELKTETTESVPEMVPQDRILSVHKGDIISKTDTQTSEQILQDKSTLRQTITTTEHIQPVRKVVLIDNAEVEKTTEEQVGVEIVEENLILPEGINIMPVGGVSVQTSVQDSEKCRDDGVWEKKKVLTKKIIVIGEIVYGGHDEISKTIEPPISAPHAAMPTQAAPLEQIISVRKGDVLTKSDTQTSEQILEDRSTLKQTVTTTQLIQPVRQIVLINGSEVERRTEEHIGTEIVEENLILPAGVHAMPVGGVNVQTSVQDSEKRRDDGVWEKKKVLTKRIMVIGEVVYDDHDAITKTIEPPISAPIEVMPTQAAPLEQIISVQKGDVLTKSDTQTSEQILEDRSTLKQTVTTTQHIQPVRQVVLVNGSEVERRTEEHIGTEIFEENLILPDGLHAMPVGGVSVSTSVRDAEQSQADGTWVRTKVMTKKVIIIGEVVYAEDSVVEGVSALPAQPQKQTLKHDVIKKVSVNEFQGALPDGTFKKSKVTTTIHIQPITEVVLVRGVERRQVYEQHVGTEILEEVTVLPNGLREIPESGFHIETDVQESESVLSDSAWEHRKVVTQRVILDAITLDSVVPDHAAPFKISIEGGEGAPSEECEHFTETLADGTVVHKRVYVMHSADSVLHRVVTEMPDGSTSEEIFSEIPRGLSQIRKPADSIEEDYEDYEEYEEMLADGSVVIKRIYITRSAGIITKRVVTESSNGQISEQVITQDISGSQIIPASPYEVSAARDKKEIPFPGGEAVIPETVRVSHTAPPSSLPGLAQADISLTAQAASPSTPGEDYDEVEEVLPDGSIVKKRIIKTKVKKMVTKKIRRVGPDGEVIEDVITEEVPETEFSDVSSLQSSNFSDAREILSPVPSLTSPGDFGTLSDSDTDRPSVKVYTDTIEGEPKVETEVQEFEETLPDGTIVKRKVIKTRQKQTVVKRVVMEGPEADLPSTEEQAAMMLQHGKNPDPDMKVYTDHIEMEPETSTDMQEYEETLDDGKVVKKRIVTTTEQQLRTERKMMEGAGAYLALNGSEVDGQMHEAIDEEVIPEIVDRKSQLQRLPPELLEEEEEVRPVQMAEVELAPGQYQAVHEDTIVAVARKKRTGIWHPVCMRACSPLISSGPCLGATGLTSHP